MKILIEPPPIIQLIAAVFDVASHKPIYAWGDTIYNPHGHDLDKSPELIAHEEMHGSRQGETEARIRLWWKDYLESPSFRLEEEIPAHRAEYRTLLRMHGSTRPNRRRLLKATVVRLRNPLYKYNHLFNFEQGKAWLALSRDEAMV